MKAAPCCALMLAVSLLAPRAVVGQCNSCPCGPLDTAFTYQGFLACDPGNTAVDNTCDFEFKLYDCDAGGTLLATASVLDTSDPSPATCAGPTCPVIVTDGHFVAQLDFGPAVFTGDKRFLEISVNCPPPCGNTTTLSPRQELTGTPYSLHAGTFSLPFAGSFSGSDATAFSISQTGTGSAASFGISNPGNYWAGLFASTNGTGPALHAVHSGTGYAGQFENLNAASGLPAMLIKNQGTGAGLNVLGNVNGSGFGISAAVFGTGWAGSFSGPDNDGSNSALRIQSPGQKMLLDGNEIDADSALHLNNNSPEDVILAKGGGFVGVGRSTAVTSAEVFGIYKNTTSFGGMYVQTSGSAGLPFYGYSAGGDPDAYHYYDGSANQWRLYASGVRIAVNGTGGGVGIGTTYIPPGVKLAVDGKVLCEEVEVQLSQEWPDFVFEDDYELMPLEQLEKEIRRERHLPGIPSADEIADKGLAVGAMQAQLLRTVEELTLHVIEVNKQVESVRRENQLLLQRLLRLEGER